MKQKIYILGMATYLTILAGILFKINHWAGAGVLMTAGFTTLVLIFLPAALINNYKAEGNRQNLPLYIVTLITVLIIFTSMLFKIQHWPYAGLLLSIAIPFPYLVFLPVFLVITSKNKNFSIYNTVFVLTLIAAISVSTALLSLNVTREKITDSFHISKNYIKSESVLNQLNREVKGCDVNMKIDEVLKTVREYQELILKQEGISPEQWKNAPWSLVRPDSKGIAARSILDAGDSSAGGKLKDQLKSLTSEMQITPGLEKIAKSAPVIFDLEVPSGNELEWADWKFNDNNLAWVLIYLDGLEVNLKMIKATL